MRVRAMTNFTGVRRRPRSTEVTDPMTAFQARLRKLGADPELVAAVATGWDEPDDEWVVPRAQLLAMSDAELVALIEQVEAENRMHTTTEAEEAAAEADQLAELTVEFAGLEAAAGGQLKVADVKAWVGSSLPRAQVAMAAEQAHDQVRPTLVAFLDGV